MIDSRMMQGPVEVLILSSEISLNGRPTAKVLRTNILECHPGGFVFCDGDNPWSFVPLHQIIAIKKATVEKTGPRLAT